VVDDLDSSHLRKELVEVPVESISLSKLTARQKIDEKNLSELASSIGRHGVIEPVILREIDGGYEIVGGTRRFLAAKRIGIETIPAIIHKVSDSEAFELAMVENLQREDLVPLEIATLLRHAVEKLGHSQRHLAKEIGKDVAWVNRHLRMLDLPQPVQSMLTRGNTLTEGHTRHLLPLSEDKQIEVAATVVGEHLTTRETEMLVRRIRAAQSSERQQRGGAREPRSLPNSETNDLDPAKWKDYRQRYYLQFYSVWPVTRRHDPFFGVNGTIYSGCFPMVVPVNCVLRYTKQNELVLDPFAGSGTTLVACAMLKRLGVGVDINPEAEKAKEKRFNIVRQKDPSLTSWLKRQRFVQGDSRNLSFIEDSSIDFVIAHPPYLDMMDYGEKGTHCDVKDYKDSVTDSFKEMLRVLKPVRFCCVQIGPYAAKHLPLHHTAFECALRVGFEFIDEVVLAFLADYVGYSSSVSGRDTPIMHKKAFADWFSIAHNVYHHNHEYLIILRKPA
jgi:ParB family chromosome partitioning protein